MLCILQYIKKGAKLRKLFINSKFMRIEMRYFYVRNGDHMLIRPAKLEDLDEIIPIYESARRYMKLSGNPNQWTDGYPERKIIHNDIINGNSFVFETDSHLNAAFTFIVGEEPTYHKIFEGAWLNSSPYGTIHRIASNGTSCGIFKHSLEFCIELAKNNGLNSIRIDTHADNLIMQKLIEQSGFSFCGIVLVRNGKRKAYQYLIE